jgi:hypothetical protein
LEREALALHEFKAGTQVSDDFCDEDIYAFGRENDKGENRFVTNKVPAKLHDQFNSGRTIDIGNGIGNGSRSGRSISRALESSIDVKRSNNNVTTTKKGTTKNRLVPVVDESEDFDELDGNDTLNLLISELMEISRAREQKKVC